MYPNYFKYRTKDLNKKFQQMVETNQMINEKEGKLNHYPEIITHDIFEDSDFLKKNFNVSFFTDIMDLNSTNISAIMEIQDDDMVSFLKGSLKDGFETIHHLQKSMYFKKKEDEFYDYKIKMFHILKDAKKFLRKKHQPKFSISNLPSFTKETREIIDSIFFSEKFTAGQIFLKQYVPKDNRDLIKEYLELVDRVDINIMYEIINKFKTFVASLNIVQEINDSFDRCFDVLKNIRLTNQEQLKIVIKYNKGIASRQRKLKNLKSYYERLLKIQEMKNMFHIINQKLSVQEYDEALQIYQSFEHDLENNKDNKILAFFRGYFNLLSENLTTYLQTHFSNSLQQYIISSFIYYNQLNENTFINDLNHSLNITYDLELDNLNWFMSYQERNFQTENGIALALDNLLKLSFVNLKQFQKSLLDSYEIQNNKLILDLDNYCQAKKAQRKKNYHKRYYFNSLKFFFDVHYTVIKKFLCSIRRVYEQIGKYIEKIDNFQTLLTSKYYLVLENLYHIFLLILKNYQKFYQNFIFKMKLKKPQYIDMKNYSLIFKESKDKFISEIFNKLFPQQHSNTTTFSKLNKNLEIGLSKEDFLSFHFQIEKEILNQFHNKQIFQIQQLLCEENWQIINISYDLKESIQKTLGKSDSYKCKTENIKLYLDDNRYYLTKSFSFVVQTLAHYIDFMEFYSAQERTIQNYICDILSIYNTTTHSLILEGKCIEYNAIHKITPFLLIFLKKELELIQKIFQVFINTKVIPISKQISMLLEDIKQHQENLMLNVYAWLQDNIQQQSLKLEEQEWELDSFKFISPSVQSCNLINYVTEMLKQIEQFCTLREFENFFDEVVKIVINNYISRMESFIQVSEQNIQSLNNERKFIIENLDQLKSQLISQKIKSQFYKKNFLMLKFIN